MDMSNLDLEGQTAPESTRGLFGPLPESSAIRRSDWFNKRQSIELSNQGKYFGKQQQQQQQQNRSSGLHTVNEEDYYNNQRKSSNRDSIHFQQDYRQRDSIDSPLIQRKQRSSVAHFNNFPLTKRPDDFDDNSNQLSRADVLAETEAKLNGHNKVTNRFNNGHTFDSGREDAFTKQNRHLSEPSSRIYQSTSYSQQQHQQQQQQQQSDHCYERPLFNKRMSFQYGSSSSSSITRDENRRLSLSSSSKLHMDNDSRSSVRDWRSKSPTTSTSSSSNSNNRPHSTVGLMNHRLSIGSSILEGGSNNGGHQRKPLFTSHLPFSSVVPHLKSNLLVSGLLRVNKRNRSDAYVFCEDFNADIYICGSRDRNRALEGDHVAIKLIEVDHVMLEKHEKEEAKLARNNGNPVVRKPDEEDEKEIIFGGEEDVDLVTPRFCGLVVSILDRAQKQVFSGTLGLTRPSNKRSRAGGDDPQQQAQRESSVPRIIWFKPTDKRVPLIAIPVEQAPAGFIENSEAFENRLFLGSIKRWPITSLHPFGVLENELGVVEDTRVQLRAILADNNFTSQPYSESLTRMIPTNLLSREAIDRDIENKLRRDMRSARCYTIVDEEGYFLENALSISVLDEEKCTYEIGLHVSDITAFIAADSALDKEARSRGIDVYHTIFEKVPLWPEQLRKEYTDLVQGQDRLAFSVIWTMTKTGEVLETWYGKTVINSNSVMTAKELEDVVVLGPKSEELTTDIVSLYSIAKALHQGRSQRALFIKTPQLDIRFQDDDYPSHISTKTALETYKILQEFQILANTQVAQKISSHFPDHALLRSQSQPNERKLRELTRYLDSLGYTIQPNSPSSLQKSIDAIENPEAKAVIITLVMKCMSQEKYFCTGAFDINRYHHYSTNAPLYTHFTCPTKRYSDVIVHRQLEAAVLKSNAYFFMEPEIVQKTAQHCNVKTRAADNANEQTQHMFASYYLANNSGVSTNRVQDAIVVGVQTGAFDVIVPGLGLERRIHTINLPLKSDTFSPSENVLHLVWIQGEATVDEGVETAISTDDDDDDHLMDTYSLRDDDSKEEEDEVIELCDSEVKRLSIKSSSTTDLDQLKKNRRRSTSIRAIQGEDAWITQKECTFPSECRQLIRPFDFVKVVITADPIRSPPLIRVLAANPFVMK